MGCNAIREDKKGGGGEGGLGETRSEWGNQNWRWSGGGGVGCAMECGIELSVQVMIRRRRCGHVRNEFHAC